MDLLFEPRGTHMENELITTLEQVNDYECLVKFDDKKALWMDEPEPLGSGKGPDPAQLLSAAVGTCLSASLLLCLRQNWIEPRDITTTVKTALVRNEKGRIRIGSIEVSIIPEFEEHALGGVGRCLDLFEDFCTVTQSLRQGIEVNVEVRPMVSARKSMSCE